MLAARDLLARVPLASAGVVYDLGCGPGNSAELLSRRFPDAEITGLDTSDSMLAHARARLPRARFVKQDIADWAPAERPQLIFANAALHFLPDHHKFFPRLAATLAPRRRVRGANAVDRARILPCADAHGRGGGAVVLASGADRQDPADDFLFRGCSRMASAGRVADRHVDDHLCSRLRRPGGHGPTGSQARPCSRSWSGFPTTSAASFCLAPGGAAGRLYEPADGRQGSRLSASLSSSPFEADRRPVPASQEDEFAADQRKRGEQRTQNAVWHLGGEVASDRDAGEWNTDKANDSGQSTDPIHQCPAPAISVSGTACAMSEPTMPRSASMSISRAVTRWRRRRPTRSTPARREPRRAQSSARRFPCRSACRRTLRPLSRAVAGKSA